MNSPLECQQGILHFPYLALISTDNTSTFPFLHTIAIERYLYIRILVSGH